MKTITRKKLNELIELIKKGATEKDILREKFGRSKTKMQKWYDTNLQFMTDEEIEIITFKRKDKEVKVLDKKKEENNQLQKVGKAYQILELHENRLNEVEGMLRELLKDKNDNINSEPTMTILSIENEVLKLKSTPKSIRINSELVEKLNEIAEENQNYSKTNIWNQALTEFIEKYKK